MRTEEMRMGAEELTKVAEGVKDPDPRQRVRAVRHLGCLRLEDEEERARAVELLGRVVHDEVDYLRWKRPWPSASSGGTPPHCCHRVRGCSRIPRGTRSR